MKIGLISDSHDNVQALENAVSLFNAAGVSLVLHAGDFISPFTAKPLQNLDMPFIGVFGNNDGDKCALQHAYSNRLHRSPYAVEFKGLQILLMHEPDCLENIAKSCDYDAIVYGHTHSAYIKEGETLIINPGECGGWVHGKRKAALWDVTEKNVSILSV